MSRFWQADWLSADRARAYGNLLSAAVLLFGAAALAYILWAAPGDGPPRPLGNDFVAFWSGARMALLGHPEAAYDFGALLPLEHAAARIDSGGFPYLYPPVWMMLCLPFAALPYTMALLAFQAVFAGLLLACLHRLLPAGWPLLPLIALPAAMLNAVIGQNGCATALCFAATALLLERRPWMAGACLGALVCKPQLALCVPVALLAAGRWRALVATAATAASLIGASWALLGGGAWRAFAAATPAIGAVLRNPEVWPKTVSVFAALRHLGGGFGVSMMGQGAAGLLALACVAGICLRRPGARTEMAAAAAAAMLCTPYLMDYDLACLAVPLAVLACTGAATVFLGGEKMVLAAGYLAPLCARGLNLAAGVPLVPMLAAALLILLALRSSRRQAA